MGLPALRGNHGCDRCAGSVVFRGCDCWPDPVAQPRRIVELIADALLGAEEILAVLHERGTRGVEEECNAGRIADVLRTVRTAKQYLT